jgi:hypothetical protein
MITFFTREATKSSVVLDHIDTNVAPTATDWYFYGLLTPWGG